MKKIGILFILFAFVILSACNTIAQQGSNADTVSQTEGSEEGTMMVIEMTADEKRLLAAIYPNENDIQEGRLFQYQVASLEVLRCGINYLKEKYPSYSVTYVMYEPASKFNPWAELWFRYEDEKIYKVIMTPEADSYRCEDTFYALVLGPAYDRNIETLLSDRGIHTKAFTSFPHPVGWELRENSTVEDLVKLKNKTSKNTILYAEIQNNKTIDDIRMTLEDSKISGNYTVYEATDLDAVEGRMPTANDPVVEFTVEE